MDRDTIIHTLDQICSDIIIRDDKIYLDGIWTVHLDITDSSMSLAWETPTGRPRREIYRDIKNMDDVVAVWSEFRLRWQQASKIIQKTLIQGTV